jgi:glycosyltransferase involved in cell wall biosynthesis
MPSVAIAMPVYNSGYPLGESLKCLRIQTYRDFEVRVFGNGSTDETSDVANSFAERDSRFKVFRNETTIQMGLNYVRAAE